MGIPGFFGWILRNYKKRASHSNGAAIIIHSIGRPVDELYIDANCMLHPSCFKVLNAERNKIPIEELESKMIDMCIKDLDYLIKYVNPKNKIYLAVDGVAPLAKINQQRKRRYKSYDETQQKNKIKEKYGVTTVNDWTNASITPGTAFMEKMHERIQKYLSGLKIPQKIIYSSYHTPGEGEHKIFDHIRDESKKIKSNVNSAVKVVYGLDADLIFLAMACHQKNIYLIREDSELMNAHDQQKNVNSPMGENQYNYVDMDVLIQCFNEQIYENIVRSLSGIGIEKKICPDLINDIIFICYLLGNDFLPHVPTIDIKKYGMEMLIDAYVGTYIKHMKPLINYNTGITDDIDINMIFFDDFIFQLSILEKEWMETNEDEKQNKRIEPNFTNQLDRELWRLDNMKNDTECYDIYKKYIGTFEDWKFRYYEHYFNCSESQEQTIKEICKNYLDGILWIAKYYFGKCPSWDWVYNYSHAPFVSDLSKFIKTQHYNINNFKMELGKPLNAVTQLLCVIPYNYAHLLPQQYIKLINPDVSPIGDMFPRDFVIDTANKDMLWQCIPILPQINLKRVNDEVEKLQKNAFVEKINKQIKDIIIK